MNGISALYLFQKLSHIVLKTLKISKYEYSEEQKNIVGHLK